MIEPYYKMEAIRTGQPYDGLVACASAAPVLTMVAKTDGHVGLAVILGYNPSNHMDHILSQKEVK